MDKTRFGNSSTVNQIYPFFYTILLPKLSKNLHVFFPRLHKHGTSYFFKGMSSDRLEKKILKLSKIEKSQHWWRIPPIETHLTENILSMFFQISRNFKNISQKCLWFSFRIFLPSCSKNIDWSYLINFIFNLQN